MKISCKKIKEWTKNRLNPKGRRGRGRLKRTKIAINAKK